MVHSSAARKSANVPAAVSNFARSAGDPGRLTLRIEA
jgi:hypothetical protein